MIQFIGLHIDTRQVRTVSLGRDLEIWSTAAAPVVNVAEVASAPGAPTVAAVPAVEWVRAAAYTIQEVYLGLPVKARKVWGVALSAPGGWIALDYGYEPVTDVRVTGSERTIADLAFWEESNQIQAGRLSAVLSPRDYVRFSISGGLATDVTEVDRLGLLAEGRTQWSARADDVGLRPSWRLPIFHSHVATGRLSAAGVRRTGVPGGTWIVAGAHEDSAGLLGLADPRREVLWKVDRQAQDGEAGRSRLVRGFPEGATVAVPAGWTRHQSGIEGYSTLERHLAVDEGTDAVEHALEVLTDAGLPTSEAVEFEADPALGAAALAAIGSGLVKGWDRYYARA